MIPLFLESSHTPQGKHTEELNTTAALAGRVGEHRKAVLSSAPVVGGGWPHPLTVSS